MHTVLHIFTKLTVIPYTVAVILIKEAFTMKLGWWRLSI